MWKLVLSPLKSCQFENSANWYAKHGTHYWSKTTCSTSRWVWLFKYVTHMCTLENVSKTLKQQYGILLFLPECDCVIMVCYCWMLLTKRPHPTQTRSGAHFIAVLFRCWSPRENSAIYVCVLCLFLYIFKDIIFLKILRSMCTYSKCILNSIRIPSTRNVLWNSLAFG